MWQSRHLVSHTSYLFPKHFYFPWNHSLIALPISAVVTYIIGKLLHYISYFSEYFSTLSTSPPLMLHIFHASSTSLLVLSHCYSVHPNTTFHPPGTYTKNGVTALVEAGVWVVSTKKWSDIPPLSSLHNSHLTINTFVFVTTYYYT